MPAANQTQGIQQLLAAEKKAAEKVAEARKRKVKRIKQAREEAEVEIETYRLQKEKAYLEFEKSNVGTKEDVVAKIEKDTGVYLAELEKMVQKNKDKVIEELVALAIDITPEVHPNFFVLKAFKKI